MRARVVVAIVGLLAVGCGEDESELSAGVDKDALCADLEAAATPIERRVVEADLIAAVEDAPDDLLAVLDGLMDLCPEAAARLLGADAPSRPRLDIALDVEACRSGEATGTVENRSDERADVTVEVQFFDSEELLLDTTNAYVRGLAGGASGRWEARYFGDDHPSRCSATLTRTRSR